MGITKKLAGPLLTVVACAALALVLGACGGTDSDTTATGGGGLGDGPDEARSIEFAECMRENGVPEFPDPEGGRFKITGDVVGLDPGSPQFQGAMEACQDLAPGLLGGGESGGGKLKVAGVEFAECMRENGVTGFPDPDFSGGGPTLKLPPGVDPASPQFMQAEEACRGILTEAQGE